MVLSLGISSQRNVRSCCKDVVRAGKTGGQRVGKRQTWAQKSALGALLPLEESIFLLICFVHL